MLVSPFRSSLVVLIALGGACSSGGAGPDASAEGGSDAAMDVYVGPDGTPPVDAGSDAPEPFVNPECTVPADAASNGSCLTLAGDGGTGDGDIACNPVTNAPCDTDAGEACDFAGNGVFTCYGTANTETVCAACDDQTTFCVGTATCVNVDGGGGACARFCCADGDCGSGHCDTTTFGTAPVGVCVQ